jgi:hypothetical protein
MGKLKVLNILYLQAVVVVEGLLTAAQPQVEGELEDLVLVS